MEGFVEGNVHSFEAGQRRILERAAGGAPLRDLLEDITTLIERQRPGHMRCSLLLVDREHACVRHGAAPSLPAEFVHRIDGSRIGPQAGSCGTAAYLGQRVIVEDIATHIMKSHQGGISVRSTAGVGTTFTLYFPAA